MNIEQKIKSYKENLDCFEETMDKYKYLLDQGKKAKPFPEEYRQDIFKIEGCQAQVWLIPKYENNKLNFFSDSDAFLTKGMITILVDIYGNNSPIEILNSDFNLLNSLNLDTILTPVRRNGVYAMLKKIEEYAKKFND